MLRLFRGSIHDDDRAPRQERGDHSKNRRWKQARICTQHSMQELAYRSKDGKHCELRRWKSDKENEVKTFPHLGAFESTKIHGSGLDVLETTRHIDFWR